MDSPPSTQTQTWLTALTAIAGTLGAVLAKKRFTRRCELSPRPSHLSPETLLAKLDSNHKEVLAAVASQGSAVEKRLDALEAAVARLDERTRHS